MIIDILDQLHVLKAHLEFAGINTSPINEAQVIKLGGVLQTGKVLKRIDLDEDIAVWSQHYFEALEKTWEEKEYGVRIIVGIEKILRVYEKDPSEVERFFGIVIRPLLGNKNSIGIIFENTSLLDEKTVSESRETASRVFDIELQEGEITFKIVKSVDFNEIGKTIRVGAQELQEYLAEDSQRIK